MTAAAAVFPSMVPRTPPQIMLVPVADGVEATAMWLRAIHAVN